MNTEHLSQVQTAQGHPAPQPVWQRLVFGRNPRRTVVRAAALAGASFVLFKFVLIPIRVTGPSMEPAYRDGSVNLVNRLSYLRREPRRGDVVAIRTTGTRVMFLKRIVALPGETIAIKEGTVLINGKTLDDPYVVKRAPWEMPPVKVEPDHHFVIGDNRGMDQQLHTFGKVESERIVGKPLW